MNFQHHSSNPKIDIKTDLESFWDYMNVSMDVDIRFYDDIQEWLFFKKSYQTYKHLFNFW